MNPGYFPQPSFVRFSAPSPMRQNVPFFKQQPISCLSPLNFGSLEIRLEKSVEGTKVYHATYCPYDKMNIIGSEFNDILPFQPQVRRNDISAYIEKFSEAFDADSVLVSLNHNNQLILLDGHHRFAAALSTGVPIELTIVSGKEETQHPNWSLVQQVENFNQIVYNQEDITLLQQSSDESDSELSDSELSDCELSDYELGNYGSGLTNKFINLEDHLKPLIPPQITPLPHRQIS